MKIDKVKAHLPTVSAYLEKRKKAKANQLPKHLRPKSLWPLGVQLALNSGLIVALFNLMVDRDDFMTEAVPAIILVCCFLLIVFTMIEAVRYRRFFEKTRGGRLATINMGLMILAFLMWAGSIVVFLS